MAEPPDERPLTGVTGVGDVSALRLMYFVQGVIVVLHMATAHRLGHW